MRYLTADGIFDGSHIHERSCLVMDGSVVVSILQLNQVPKEVELEHFEGLLCPGFINTHCHLELSHLHNKIPKHTGLPGFISKVQEFRNSEEDFILSSILEAAQEMHRSGVVGLGDISNGSDSLEVKKLELFETHTFLEVFGFNPNQAETAFERTLKIKDVFDGHKHSLVPHAPYSVSVPLFQKIFAEEYEKPPPLTIHNQECIAETEMFEAGTGALYQQLERFGLNMTAWTVPQTSSLKAVLPYFPKGLPVILVHNTFTTKEDRLWANQIHSKLYWCTCPKANLYIENSLPNYPEMLLDNCTITIGTDSLASNNSLDIWEEIKVIHHSFPKLELKELLKWATSNGAEALGFEHLGEFKPGKSPGVVHLPKGFEFSDKSGILINFAKS